MVLYGMESTVGVTLEMMIAHGQAVMRGVKHACVIVDLPFGSYQESKEQAFRSAARIMKETGCDGVKLEGGEEMAETVAFLTARGIPVFGHVGLMPQQVNTTGGYRSLGRSEKEADKIRSDAQAIAEAGAFAYRRRGNDRAAGAGDHRRDRRPDHRHRRIAGLRRTRSWSPTTCSASSTISSRASSSTSPNSPRWFRRRPRRMPTKSRRGHSRPGAYVQVEEIAGLLLVVRLAFQQIDGFAEIFHLLRQGCMRIL